MSVHRGLILVPGIHFRVPETKKQMKIQLSFKTGPKKQLTLSHYLKTNAVQSRPQFTSYQHGSVNTELNRNEN